MIQKKKKENFADKPNTLELFLSQVPREFVWTCKAFF